jgi:hypothetical protein
VPSAKIHAGTVKTVTMSFPRFLDLRREIQDHIWDMTILRRPYAHTIHTIEAHFLVTNTPLARKPRPPFDELGLKVKPESYTPPPAKGTTGSPAS